ncbi:hypothetical protein PIIN_02827 [Serendipita indica DSM 11827]|uniref:RING-type E3 ubiquitin transferase n=1 Tax=Serendipita indica (strain DSM 11827) TaxID=1109443 RepID=G4TCC4_SERID|nr:hypothetical protein PIIN_02827 [Serendipita indica DSM 11827]
MPSTLPASILVKPLLGQLANSFLFFLRLVLVATLWLAIIPALLYWSWQLGFMLGDYVSLRLSGHLDYIEMYVGSTVNASQTPIISMPSTSFSSSLLDAQLRPTSPVLTLQTTPAAIPPHESFISSTFLLRDTIPLSIHPVGSTLSHPGPSILAPPASQHPPMNSKPQNPWYMGPPDAEAKTLYRLLHDKVADLFAKDHPYPLLSIIFGSVQILSYLLYWLGWWLIMSGISLLLLPYDLYKFNVSRCTSERILAHSFLDRVTKELSGPIVSGQFIAIIMVATYICLWFLREWIVENADDERLRRRQPGNNQPAANPQGEQDPPPDLEEFFDDLVEPPTPPLNIISLDDQAELMKEVQKRRAERAEQERKSRDIIKEWQVEKTSEIVAGWKEQKLKEIQHRLGDNATPLIDRNGEMLVADPRENTPQEILWAPLASDSPAVEQVEYIENTELAQATAVMSSKVYTPRLPLPTALPVESAVSSQQITTTASSNLSISMQRDGSPKADPHSTHKEISEVPPSSAEPEKIDKEPAGEIALKFTEILPAVSPSEPALPPVQHLPSQVPPAIPISELSEPKRSFTPPLPSPSVFRALVPPPNATDALPDGTIPPLSLDPRPSSSASSTSSPWDAETSKFFPNKRPRRPSSSASSMDLRTNFRKPPFPPAKQGTPASTSPSTPTSEGARSTTTFSFTFPASQNMPKADKVFMKKPVATSGLNVNAPAFQPRIMAPVAHPFNVNAPTFIPTAASSTQVPGSQPSIGDPFLQGLSQVPQWAHGPHLAGAYDNRLSMVPSSGLTAFQSESSSTMPPRPDSVLPHLAYAMKNPVSGESSGSTPAQAARMTHGHSMSMGMGHRTKAIEETPRPRGRALTTGAGVSHSSISKSQSVSRLSTTNLQTSPPRSSSLSAQTPRRLGEANPLLQPRAPESASPKSAPNAQTMPWYGLPDPRPGLDRDLEMELKIKADYKAWREKVKPIDEARERKLKAFLEKYEADKAAAEAAEKAKADGVKPDVAVNNQGATEGNNDGPRIMAETGVSKDQDNSCPEVKVPQTSGEHVTSPVPEPKAPEEQSPLQISTSKVLPEPPAISQTSSNRSRSPGPIPSSKASIVEDSSVTPLERPSGSGPIKSAPNTRRDADRDMEMERKIKADYQAWREKVKPIDEARERRLKAFWEKYEADKAATEAAEKAKVDGVKLNATVKDQGATKSNNGPGAIAENEASKDQDNW